MVSSYFKPLNIACILCYIAFMSLAMNSAAVDAVVLFVTEKNGKPVYTKAKTEIAPVASADKEQMPLVAIKYSGMPVEQTTPLTHETAAEATANAPVETLLTTDQVSTVTAPAQIAAAASTVAVSRVTVASEKTSETVMETFAPAKRTEQPVKKQTEQLPARTVSNDVNNAESALTYIEAAKTGKWEYATLLDRYIVQYDKETYIVLTIRPALQRILEDAFKSSSTRIGAGIIQDPATGEILAMTSSHRNQLLAIDSDEFKTDNWVLKPTFPVASIFKIVGAAAGIDTKALTANSSFLAYGKTYMKVWKAFATSHNAVFGRMARKTGRSVLNKYAEAFGFNKPFFFDLPVGKSIAELPTNAVKMGQAAAGLNRDFLVSPIHVASIISTVLNRGRTMKPYLVDYVVRKNKVVFRRKPFQVAQPIKSSTARDLYKMMYATTAVGTGKKGFGGFRNCPDLAKICGGKTGTLTGASPHYLYTWFGGFTKATGRDLCIVTLSGQQNHSGIKAASIAGKISHDLYMMRNGKKNTPVVSSKKK